MEVLSKNSENWCSVIFKIISRHMANLPIGKTECIEMPITTVRRAHFQIKDINKLPHSIVHPYHPDIIQLINVHHQDLKRTSTPSEDNHFDL